MSVADASRLTTPDPVEGPVLPSPPPTAVPWSSPEWRPAGTRPWASARVRQDGLSARTGQLLAAGFAVAWILCPVVEPMPTHEMPWPLWQVPIDLAAFASIVAAVIVLWRGGRNGARLGAVAGILMAVETAMCPFAGHTPVGWWTWVQTGLSLLVLGTSAALMARRGRAG